MKPGNLMLVPDPLGPGGERVKVLDFGIAKLLADTRGKTSSHAVMGTPIYMSPEQCRGAGMVDAKADVYSLGVILFQMLAGRPPFEAEAVGEIIGKHLFMAPPRLRSLLPEVPSEIDDFVNELLGKDKDRRPGMQEVAQRLSRLVGHGSPFSENKKSSQRDKPRRGHSSALLLIAGSFAAGGLILYFGMPSQRPAPVADLAVVAANPTPPPPISTVASPPVKGETPLPAVPRPSAPVDPEKVVAEAQKQYVAGRYERAIELARSAQRGSPARAWRIIGSAACALKDRPLVDESLTRLDAAGRGYVEGVCGRHGIQLGEQLFKPVK